MKTKLAQFASFTSQIDHRYLQIACFVLVLAVSMITKSPSDGGTGPY